MKKLLMYFPILAVLFQSCYKGGEPPPRTVENNNNSCTVEEIDSTNNRGDDKNLLKSFSFPVYDFRLYGTQVVAPNENGVTVTMNFTGSGGQLVFKNLTGALSPNGLPYSDDQTYSFTCQYNGNFKYEIHFYAGDTISVTAQRKHPLSEFNGDYTLYNGNVPDNPNKFYVIQNDA